MAILFLLRLGNVKAGAAKMLSVSGFPSGETGEKVVGQCHGLFSDLQLRWDTTARLRVSYCTVCDVRD